MRDSKFHTFRQSCLLPMICLAMFSPSIAPAYHETFTPEHVAKLRSVASAEMSPDGRFVAYVLRVPRNPFKDEDGPAWEELHIIGPEGSSRPFVTGEVNVGSAAWAPDGKSVSFLAKRGKDKTKSIYIIPIDGGEARKVLSRDTDITGFSWSHDGTRIAFLATQKSPKEKEKLKDKGFKQEVFEEDVKPIHAWVITPDEPDIKPRMFELEGSVSSLRWSPVDERIALALAPTPSVDDGLMDRRIHFVDADSGKVLNRINNPGKLADITWSPDGKTIAFLSAEDLHDPSAGRLMIAAAGEGPLTDLLPAYKGDFSSIAWQDNETVMFINQEGTWSSLGEISIRGTDRKTHIPIGKTVLSGLSLSRDGRSAAFLAESPTHPTEVFVMRHGDSGPKRMTDSNPWLSEMEFAPQEVITFKARDGLELEGLLIQPLNEEKGLRYPLILTVHGGPGAHYTQGWLTSYSNPGQVAAAGGFAVFYPNYRGSTGRGVAFSKMGQADYAGKEFDDLVDAVDHLVESGLVDRAKVGVTGGSYGGFASAWCATYYSDRFAASVMNVGLSDLISKAGTTDIPNEMHLVHGRKWPWEDWRFFLERSPIFHVQKARTPILIMHGKDDTRVHPSQSLELHRHLKTINQAPVRLVLYPGEGHGNRKAASRYDYNLRMMQWFEHYLKGPAGNPPPSDLDYGPEAKEKDDEK